VSETPRRPVREFTQEALSPGFMVYDETGTLERPGLNAKLPISADRRWSSAAGIGGGVL